MANTFDTNLYKTTTSTQTLASINNEDSRNQSTDAEAGGRSARSNINIGTRSNTKLGIIY